MDTPGTGALERTHTDLELELIAELDTIARDARAAEVGIAQKRVLNGVYALQKIHDRARDAARHARARTLTQETAACP